MASQLTKEEASNPRWRRICRIAAGESKLTRHLFESDPDGFWEKAACDLWAEVYRQRAAKGLPTITVEEEPKCEEELAVYLCSQALGALLDQRKKEEKLEEIRATVAAGKKPVGRPRGAKN